jgi:hypothetical protein
MTTGFLALLLVASGTAFAQVQTPAQGPQPDPNAAPPDKYGAPIDPRPKSTDSSQAPLSQDLSRSDGVVHPTGSVDPGMSQTPPDPGPNSTPVIKPPPTGSTGVNPQ